MFIITLSLVSSFQSPLFPHDANLITKEDGHTVPFLMVPAAGQAFNRNHEGVSEDR